MIAAVFARRFKPTHTPDPLKAEFTLGWYSGLAVGFITAAAVGVIVFFSK